MWRRTSSSNSSCTASHLCIFQNECSKYTWSVLIQLLLLPDIFTLRDWWTTGKEENNRTNNLSSQKLPRNLSVITAQAAARGDFSMEGILSVCCSLWGNFWHPSILFSVRSDYCFPKGRAGDLSPQLCTCSSTPTCSQEKVPGICLI